MNQPDESPPNPKAITLITNITQLMDEVEEELRDPLNQQEGENIKASSPVIEDAAKCVAVFFHDAGEKIAAGVRRTDQVVNARPYRALALAFGMGTLIGAHLASLRRVKARGAI